MILVDSNVLVDVLSEDPNWLDWSLDRLAAGAAAGRVVINEVVYAELCAQSLSDSELDDALRGLRVELEWIPKQALCPAGKAYSRYRKSGGVRTGVLADFFVGAHAQASGYKLLSRDVGRYRTYFPSVELIAP